MSLVSLALSLLLLALAAAANDPVGSGAIVLNAENFASVRSKPTFVKFYAPWCGHCVHLAPTWDELAQQFNHGSLAAIAKVDCTAYPTICQEYGVRSYPTLKLFHDGEVTDYSGGRTVQAFSKFVHEHVAPLDAEPAGTDAKPEDGLYVGTEENFNSIVSSGFAFVKFFAPWCGHCKHLAPTWAELAQHYKESSQVKIVHVDCTQQGPLCQRFQIMGYPTLRLFHNGEPTDSPYQGGRTLAALTAYVDQHAAPAGHTQDL